MSDIFLSYAHEDLAAAQSLASLIEANGLSVWWDRRLFPGDKFHALIDQELEKAKAVLVLWSPKSVVSDWVLGEAQTARGLNKLIPIKISECKLPLPYRAIHTPEIYRTKDELDKLARLLTAKFNEGGSGMPAIAGAAAPKIEFSAKSSLAFIAQFSRQMRAYHVEYAELRKELVWYNPASWVRVSRKQAELDKKYSAQRRVLNYVAVGWVLLVFVFMIFSIVASKLG